LTDALALGEKLLSLLEQSARSSTYKPALLLALIDRVQEYGEAEQIPVRALAERVIELYWPQTLTYPTTGAVLRQNNAGGQASIVSAILDFREQHASASRALPDAVRRDTRWPTLVDRVEATLAEWPIPRLQRPYESFVRSGPSGAPAGRCGPVPSAGRRLLLLPRVDRRHAPDRSLHPVEPQRR